MFHHLLYTAEILRKQRKTLSNQSINQSINHLLNQRSKSKRSYPYSRQISHLCLIVYWEAVYSCLLNCDPYLGVQRNSPGSSPKNPPEHHCEAWSRLPRKIQTLKERILILIHLKNCLLYNSMLKN